MKINSWTIWGVATLAFVAYLLFALLAEDKTLYLPGQTSHGHYQIEMQCDACHAEAFGGEDVLQDACMNCHGKELKRAKDSHPKSKFTDPRNANRLEKIDARVCVACHQEHVPEQTRVMGVTVANDVCFYCHSDIAEDRPSHEPYDFNSCASAGCHNYHDNRALYEDFLLKHQHEAPTFDTAVLPKRNAAELGRIKQTNTPTPLSAADADMPSSFARDDKVILDWQQTAHAEAGINCSDCHQDQKQNTWIAKPEYTTCQSCHDKESEGFLEGKHGMRLKAALPVMTPALARQPMRSGASHKELDCNSCHGEHRFDTRHAAVEACLGCHNDEHSLAYKKSSHYQLWRSDNTSGGVNNTGVSCASCHLPRLESDETIDGEKRIIVQHNQNDNLRPNEKMIRDVCMNCHGLGFAIDSLADRELINVNFSAQPSQHIESIDLAIARQKNKGNKKEDRD